MNVNTYTNFRNKEKAPTKMSSEKPLSNLPYKKESVGNSTEAPSPRAGATPSFPCFSLSNSRLNVGMHPIFILSVCKDNKIVSCSLT